MNRRETYQRETLLRVQQFMTENPLTPSSPCVMALQAALTGVVTEIEGHMGDQDSGRGLARGGTSDCRRIARELRAIMRLASDIGKTLNPADYPGLSQLMRMPENSYVSLERRARVFVEAVTPIKAAFIERMMPADFDQSLQRLIDDFVRARERKHTGRAEQVGGTAGLSAAIRRGMQLAREIDAIMKAAYANDPSRLAAWKSAVRVQGAPKSSTESFSPGRPNNGLLPSTTAHESEASLSATIGPGVNWRGDGRRGFPHAVLRSAVSTAGQGEVSDLAECICRYTQSRV
jgi:hypothetical protein